MDRLIKYTSFFVGSVFSIFLGVRIFIGDPYVLPYRSYKSMPQDMQDRLIETFGETTIGVIFVALGVALGVSLIWIMLRDR